MNRRVAILIGSVMAAFAAGEIIVLSGLLAAERQGDRERYDAAMARQRRAAGRLAQASPLPPTRVVPRTFCVRGVDTFVATARKTLQKELLDGERRLDTAELIALSDLAIRAERYVETSNAGPALPQRLGRVRNDPEPDQAAGEPKPDQAAAEPEWRALEPARLPCEDSEAYAVFRLTIDAPPGTAETHGPTTKPAPKANKKQRSKKPRSRKSPGARRRPERR